MINPSALASFSPATRVPADMGPDEALRFQFAKMLVAEVRKAMPTPEGFDALGGLGPVLDDALAKSIADKMPDRLTAGGREIGKHHVPGVTSGFGQRLDPFHGERRMHRGVDLAATEGSAIKAARDGTVVFSGARGGYGNLVIVDHGDGLLTRYAHMKDLSVNAGDAVTAGSQVGTVGSTGRSTGPHLHFEVRKGGLAVDPMALAAGVL